MPVNNVNSSEGARAEQLRTQQTADNAQAAQRQQNRDEDASREVRRVAEEGRGENMDVTV